MTCVFSCIYICFSLQHSEKPKFEVSSDMACLSMNPMTVCLFKAYIFVARDLEVSISNCGFRSEHGAQTSSSFLQTFFWLKVPVMLQDICRQSWCVANVWGIAVAAWQMWSSSTPWKPSIYRYLWVRSWILTSSVAMHTLWWCGIPTSILNWNGCIWFFVQACKSLLYLFHNVQQCWERYSLTSPNLPTCDKAFVLKTLILISFE